LRVTSRGLGDVYKRQARLAHAAAPAGMPNYFVARGQPLARALDFKIDDPALRLSLSDKWNDGLVQRVHLVAL
jgi:hypothetical protein